MSLSGFKLFLQKIKYYLELLVICFSSVFFILSNILFIKQSYYYWSDYVLLIYSFLFLFLMIFHSILPNKFPDIIRENFGMITNNGGKGILMLIISVLYIKEEIINKKFHSLILFISGTFLIVLEYVSPTVEINKKKNNTRRNEKKKVKINQTDQMTIDEKLRRKYIK
jgi:hypothetical protein